MVLVMMLRPSLIWGMGRRKNGEAMGEGFRRAFPFTFSPFLPPHS